MLLEILKWNLAKMRPSNKVDSISTIFPDWFTERSIMRHLTIESLIGLAEGTLSPRDKQDVEDHLLNCALCFAEASDFLVVELQASIESRTKFWNAKRVQNGMDSASQSSFVPLFAGDLKTYSRRQFLFVRSFIFACCTVSHCMFEGMSAPPIQEERCDRQRSPCVLLDSRFAS